MRIYSSLVKGDIMRKITFLLVLIPSLSFGAITPNQIKQVQTVSSEMRGTLLNLQLFVSQVRGLIENGNSYSLGFSTNTVALTTEQQQDIVNYYNSLKTQLVTEFNQLP